MTYYEELGITRGATEAEIRKSYKRLTLLLHPDQQIDPEIRALAETQMKRINEIIGVLSNPHQRSIYDQSLTGKLISVIQVPSISRLARLRNHRGWLLVGVAFAGFCAAVLLMPPAVPLRSAEQAGMDVRKPIPGTPAVARPGNHVPAAQPVKTLSSAWGAARPREVASNPDPQPAAGPVLPVAADQRSESAVSLPQELFAPSGAVWAPSAGPPALPGKNESPEVCPLSGKWVYAQDPSGSKENLDYPADYVELTVIANASVLRGSYRSRYKLSDRTLNPYANFTFTGPTAGTTFVWRGDANAQGQLTLRLESSETLRVNWFATKMGSELSLGSGTATLYRVR